MDMIFCFKFLWARNLRILLKKHRDCKEFKMKCSCLKSSRKKPKCSACSCKNTKKNKSNEHQPLLQKIYDKVQSAVRLERHQGEWFPTNVGTPQGDPLSSLLFSEYLERVMDHVKESNCGIRLGRTLVNNLKFADDIELIDEDYKSRQEQLEKTRTSGADREHRKNQNHGVR